MENQAAEAHHIQDKSINGMGMKCSDDLTAGLCRICHQLMHSAERNKCLRRKGYKSQFDLVERSDAALRVV